MTTQIKRYVQLADVKGIRFACKNCKSELFLPLQRSTAQDQPADSCPNCSRPWMVVNGKQRTKSLDELVRSLWELSEWPGECEVTLEVSGE